MFFSKSVIIAFASGAFAANHNVVVGQNNGLTFTPSTVTAAVGDTVTYQFATQNHTVTSGNANAGCTPDGKFYSGFVPATAPAAAAKPKGNKMVRGVNNLFDLEKRANSPTFTVAVANTQPQVVYCSQAQHCQSGMVMVINPSTSGATSLQQYQQAASKAKTNVIPKTGVTGGTLNAAAKANAAAKPAASGAAKPAAGAAKGKKAGKKTGKAN